jgi:hypothetical protein
MLRNVFYGISAMSAIFAFVILAGWQGAINFKAIILMVVLLMWFAFSLHMGGAFGNKKGRRAK